MTSLSTVCLPTEADPSKKRNIWCVDRRDARYLHRQIFDLDAYNGPGIELTEGDVIVDVGANIGMFLLFVARRLQHMTYYALEPVPHIYDALEKNAAELDQEVHCLKLGLADREGEVTFDYHPRTPCCSTMYPADTGIDHERARSFTLQMIHQAVPRWLSGVIHRMPQFAQQLLVDRVKAHYGWAQKVTCRIQPLSQVIDEQGMEKIDLLKIDAERAELDILRGIESRHWPLIRQMILEVHYPPGERYDELVELLHVNGFHIVDDSNPTNDDSQMFFWYGSERVGRPAAHNRGKGREIRRYILEPKRKAAAETETSPDEPMKSSTYIRVAVVTLIAMGAVALPVIWGSNQGVRTMFNAPLQWIPRNSTSRAEFNRFLDEFEIHEIVLVSWDGCTINDPRLEELAETLLALRDERAAAGQPELFNQVLTGYTLLRWLQDPPAELTRKDALRRLKGTFVGADGRTSCAAVVLTEAGGMQRRETLPLIQNAIGQVTGLGRDQLRIAGPTMDGLATDDESIRSLQHYSLPAILISLVLCSLCLRSVWLTLPILAVGALGQAAVLAAVYYLNITMNAILIVLPPLVFVLTVSAGVHLVNYYYDELRTGRTAGATQRAFAKGWGPCMLAAVTTAVGLASLMVSDVRPVRQFGALAACGVLFTVVLLFLLLPGFTEGRRRMPRVWRRAGPSRRSAGSPGAFWQTAGSLIGTYAGWISVACFVLLSFCSVGLIWLRSSIDVVSLLSAKNRAVQDFRWFEANIGPLVPVEVVLHFDPSCTLDELQRMECVESAQQAIREIDILDGAMSAATFFPRIPPAGGWRATVQRAVLRKRLETIKPQLVETQYLNLDEDHESWRISARILGQDDFDYSDFLGELRKRVDPVIGTYEEAGFSGISASYTGVTSVVHEVEEALLADLFDSFLTALACVTLIMMVALRSFRAGLIAMVPNVFPTLILFGSMGWLGRPVDIGTVMTASVALGIAVDGTFHFLKWFRHEIQAGKSRRDAVGYAYRHCGRALTQTTVICALGLLVFALSGFLPVRHFSLNLLLLLVAALVGDLVVLPALLVGPLGSFFVRRIPVADTVESLAPAHTADGTTLSP